MFKSLLSEVQYEVTVPTVSDRIAQGVVKGYLEPELEKHFHPDSYGYRPGKSALQAVGKARERCWRYAWVLDLDVRAFLDESSHYTSGYCGWIKKVWKRCRYLYSDAFCAATVDMNCLQLAALYTLQDGLARDTEQIHGLEHFHVPIGAFSTNSERSSSVMRMRHGAPGVTCSPAMKPSLSQRCKVDGARPSACAARSTVMHSPSRISLEGSKQGIFQLVRKLETRLMVKERPVTVLRPCRLRTPAMTASG